MPNISSTPLTFYPAYCFGLSPTLHDCWAKLTVADVHALNAREGFEGMLWGFGATHVLTSNRRSEHLFLSESSHQMVQTRRLRCGLRLIYSHAMGHAVG